MKLPKPGDKVEVISLKGLRFNDLIEAYGKFVGKTAITKKFEKFDSTEWSPDFFCDDVECTTCTCKGSIQLEGTHASIYYCDERFRLVEDNNNDDNEIPTLRVKSRLEDLIL